MRRLRPSRETATAYLVIAVGVLTLLILLLDHRRTTATSPDGQMLVVFLAAMLIAEQVRLELPGRAAATPLALAIGLAMALSTGTPTHPLAGYGAGECVLTAGGGMLFGSFVQQRRQPDSTRWWSLANDVLFRVFSVGVAAVLMRTLAMPGGAALKTVISQSPGWLRAIAMVAVAGTAILVEALLRSIPRAASEHSRWPQAAQDEVRAAFGLGTAISITGALIAICLPTLGLIAVPLMMLPLALTQVAMRRHTATRETYRQSVDALSRMPEAVGFIPRGHAQQVAELAVAVGRELGMSERDVRELETSALLHDIGQVALRYPIPRGATVQAATADQQRIADDGAEIVRSTGILVRVAQILAKQAVPYHRVVERSELLPIASRIIKVVNAYVDLSGAHPAHTGTRAGSAVALERIYLGLGYEYDPSVVGALERVLTRQR